MTTMFPLSRPSRRRIRLALLVAAAALASAACGDGSARANDARTEAGDVDLSLLPSEAEALRAIEHPVEFELGEARLEQLLTARERLAPLAASEAEDARQLDVREAGLDASGAALGQVVDRLQASAETRRAIEGSGLSVRDYVSGTFAMQQAVLARGVDARGALPPVLLGNMQVVERNADRVAQLAEGTPFAPVVAAWSGRAGAAGGDFAGLTAAAAAPPAIGPAASRTTASPSSVSSGDASRAARRDYDSRPRGKAKSRKKGKGDRDD